METGNGTEQEVETGHMTESYLNILQESLEKKLQVMAEIQKYSLLQQEIFQSEEADLEKYDEYVDKKDELLEKLTALDNGFETLYKGLSEELQGNRERYAGQIRRLQELVTKVTEDSGTRSWWKIISAGRVRVLHRTAGAPGRLMIITGA